MFRLQMSISDGLVSIHAKDAILSARRRQRVNRRRLSAKLPTICLNFYFAELKGDVLLAQPLEGGVGGRSGGSAIIQVHAGRN